MFQLDADEFIDARRVGGLLRSRLNAVPEAFACLHLPLVNYHAPGPADDLLVPRRFTLRDTTDRKIYKCVVRGSIVDRQLEIDAGNHGVWLDGVPAPIQVMEDIVLAHYPHRHALQWLTKATLGRLKVLATGGNEAEWSTHYTPVLDILRDDPAQLLSNPAFLATAPPPIPLTEDPIAYAGLPLRFTQPSDPLMKAVRCLAAAAERLARQHGRLLAADPDTRARADRWSMETEVLF